MPTKNSLATMDDIITKDFFDFENCKIKTVNPKRAVLDITTNCNQRCPFCYKSTAISKKDEHFSKGNILKVADFLRSVGISLVTLSGGEPLSHPEIKNIIEELHKKGFGLGIVTNACYLDEKIIDVLKRNSVDVEVTILGPNGYDDFLTGVKNRHQLVLGNLRKLYENHIPIGIVSNLIRFCVTERDYLFRIVQELYEKMGLKIAYFGLQRIVPTEGSKDYYEEMYHISKKNLRIVMKQLDRISNEFKVPKVYTVDCIPFCAVAKKYWKYLSPCAYGVEMLAVSGNGKVRRCPCSEISLGNVFQEDLNSIWKSHEFSDFRELRWLPDKCKACKKVSQCLGGCSKSAIASLGKDHYRDCYVEP